MKKYLLFFAAVSFAALAVSCSVESNDTPELIGKVILSATAEDALSKAAVDGDGVFTWSADDKILVYATATGQTPVAVPFDLISGENTGKAKFAGELPEGYVVDQAFYPYSFVIGETVENQEINLPTTYNYVPGKVLTPMSAELDAESILVFKHLCGAVSLTLSDVPEDAVRIVLTTPGKKITGSDLTITSSPDGASQIVSEASDSENTISVELTLGAYTTVSTLIPIPAGTYESLSVAVEKADGTVIVEKKAYVANTVARKGILSMPAFSVEEESGITDIKTGQELVDFLASTDAEDTGKYRIVADLDMTGLTVTPAPGFAGTLDGRNHKIKNLASPMFKKLSGTVKNVKVDASSAIVYEDDVPDMMGLAFIADQLTGNVLDCEVAGSITVKSASAGRIYCAGIVGESTTGYIEGCKFTGSIDVEFSGTSASCSAIAGVAARVGHASMAGKTIVKNCVNEGSVKFLFSGDTGGMKKFGIGGVIGQTPSLKVTDTTVPMTEHGIIEDCVNRGNLEWSYPAGGTGSYPCFGGVAGIIEGQLKNASNYGKLTYKGGKEVAATDVSIGGVAGYVTGNVSNCHNYGIFNLDAAFAGGTALAQSGGNTSFTTIGGVFGNVGPYVKDNTYAGDKGVVAEDISNEAEIVINTFMVNSGGPKMCLGGVIGASTANLKNVVNNKPVTVITTTKTMYVGGVAGYLAADMENCINNAALVLDGNKDNHPAEISSEQAYMGGVVGYVIKGSKLTSCKNLAPVTMQNIFTTPGAWSYVGGINGSYNGSFTMTNCENSGAVTNNADTPIVIGGVSGSFNGTMTGVTNSGKVSNASSYLSTTATKESEVGGLVGYFNATIYNCTNTGAVVNNSEGSYTSGLFASTTETNLTPDGNTVKCPITAASSELAAALLGRHRNADSSEYSTTFTNTIVESTTINGVAVTADNLVATTNGATINVEGVTIK